MTNKKPKSKPTRKQNHERLSLYGQKPEKMIKAFMEVPLAKILKREEKNRVR
jgi:hypothetical protein